MSPPPSVSHAAAPPVAGPVTVPPSEPRPGVASAPPASAPPTGLAVAPAAGEPKSPPARLAAPTPPAAGPLAEALRTLTLDVLVYSEDAAERMVFISGRKYVEGQTVDGTLLLDSITREGVILSAQGQRALLRPRSNPYVRP